jgi:hypothetical protein
MGLSTVVRMIATPDQLAAVRKIASDPGPGCIVGAEIGAGKTFIAVEGGLERYARRWLIVAPLSTYENWERTIASQTDGYGVLRACGLVGYAGVKPKALKANMEAFMRGDDGFYFMGREFWIDKDWEWATKPGPDGTRVFKLNAKGQKMRVRTSFYKKAQVDVLIFDEAHFASNKTSRGYRTFMHFPAEYKTAVSGTFFGNNFENAYTLPNAIWGDSLTDTFALWKVRYCATKFDPFTYDKMKVTGELNPGAWVEALPNYIFIEGHKGEVIPEEYFVDLHAGQRRMYDQMDRDFATKAESGEYVLADLKVEARTRLRQISVAEISVRESEKKNGSADAPPIEVYFPANAKSAKYDELLRLLRQHDEQVLISLDFTKAAVRITEWLKRDGISAGLYAGATHTTPTARMRLRESFLAGETRCMVGIPAAMGTGTDGLQTVCRRLYIISEDQNGVTGEQMIGRLDRKGQERPVIITNIHARNTLDLGITTSLAMQAIANAESRALDMANAST